MENFPTGRNERDELLAKNASSIERFKDNGVKRIKNHSQYTWLDSPLESSHYGVQHSFYKSFMRVIPHEERSLKHYIETCLKDKKGQAIGVEFGGVGVNAFSDFSEGFFKQSVGITLVDHREILDYSDGGNVAERIKEINHIIMLGDILSPQTYDNLSAELHNKKIDLIIERMAAGLEFIPAEPYYVSKLLQIWYRMLNENGLMLVQVPVKFNDLLDKWATQLQEDKYLDTLDFDYTLGDTDRGTTPSAFRLQKLAGAPEDLPMLSPNEVKEAKIVKPREEWF